MRLAIRKAEYFVPAVVLLKAMLDVSDRTIYDQLVATATAEQVGSKDGTGPERPDPFVADRVEIMLRMVRKDLGLTHHAQCLAYLGDAFRVVLGVPDATSDRDAGQRLLDDYIFVHLTSRPTAEHDKFNLLVHMIQKVYALVSGRCEPNCLVPTVKQHSSHISRCFGNIFSMVRCRILEDNPDSPMNQEILLPGPLFLSILKEKLYEYLGGIRGLVLRDLRRAPGKVQFDNAAYLTDCMKRNPVDVTRKMEYFLATGNLQSDTGLDLMQISGYTIVGERLNYMRFLAHFRSIHRGPFSQPIRVSSVGWLLCNSIAACRLLLR
jgi:DNA-directed RNA polymerase I subunit RPA2